MVRPKLGFLSWFFIALGVAFSVALWVRIRAYRDEARPAQRSQRRTPPSLLPEKVIVPRPDFPAPARGGAPRTGRRGGREVVPPPVPPPSPAGPPADSPAGQEKPGPSLLSRIVTPIVNAVGGNRAPQPQQPAPAAGQTLSSASRSPSRTDSTGSVAQDPTSDTQPPQLLAIGFNPPQVRDGEETMLIIQASDDLSGIRSISGTIAAPSGAVQGFAVQREADSNQYATRITVPKNAAEGVWRVNYLSLIDNASNTATLSAVQGALPQTASFRVLSSDADSSGPTLRAVWVERRAMQAGEKNMVFVQADDDKSGLSLVSGVFLSPQKHARVGFVCRQGASSWECELSAPACLDCGDWQLEQLQLQDKANNMTTVRPDNPLVAAVHLNINGIRCDSNPPLLQTLTLDRAAVSNAESSVITISATAADDFCGLMSMSGQASGPSAGAHLYFSFTPSEGPTWTARLIVPKLAAKGVWRVSWIQILDHGHNLKTYGGNDPALSGSVFRVQ